MDNIICYSRTISFVPSDNVTCTLGQCHLYPPAMSFIPQSTFICTPNDAICIPEQCHLYSRIISFVPRTMSFLIPDNVICSIEQCHLYTRAMSFVTPHNVIAPSRCSVFVFLTKPQSFRLEQLTVGIIGGV